ncbi:MAG: hypothetical protein KH304_05280 [Clostridium sp.]|nr:hypothetical protein [Clostridium sp.]
MKKKVVGIVMASTLLLGTATTALAAGNPAGGTTDVYVGVTNTTPANISVTVPTALAIAVVSADSQVTTLMGNYMVDDGGNITMSGDASQGIKDQRVTFVNNGDVAAKVTGAKIINSHGSKWTIDNTAGSAHELSLKLNSVLAGTIAPDNNATITLNDFALPANEVAHMAAEVKAGGTAGDYSTPEKSAKSFVIEWNIAAQ